MALYGNGEVGTKREMEKSSLLAWVTGGMMVEFTALGNTRGRTDMEMGMFMLCGVCLWNI